MSSAPTDDEDPIVPDPGWREQSRGLAWRHVRQRPDGKFDRREGVGSVRHLIHLPPVDEAEAQAWLDEMLKPGRPPGTIVVVNPDADAERVLDEATQKQDAGAWAAAFVTGKAGRAAEARALKPMLDEEPDEERRLAGYLSDAFAAPDMDVLDTDDVVKALRGARLVLVDAEEHARHVTSTAEPTDGD